MLMGKYLSPVSDGGLGGKEHKELGWAEAPDKEGGKRSSGRA